MTEGFPTPDVDVTHLVVVSDAERSKVWYGDVLGAKVERERRSWPRPRTGAGRSGRSSEILTATSSRSAKSARRPGAAVYLGSICMTANTAPAGSESTLNTATGISIGSISTVPPSSRARSVIARASSAAK